VCSLVPVHVSVGCEGLRANLTGERALAGMNQHVSVQRTEGGQHFPTEAAVIYLGLSSGVTGVCCWLHFIVTSQMGCKLLQGCHVVSAQRAFEVAGSLTVIVACLLIFLIAFING